MKKEEASCTNGHARLQKSKILLLRDWYKNS